jgi:carbamoyl-phosphate synthase large subunit
MNLSRKNNIYTKNIANGMRAIFVGPGSRRRDKNFLEVIKNICSIESVDAVISVVDEELEYVIKLEELGIAVIQPRLSFVNLCLDKYKCMQELRKVGIGAPETWLLNELPDDVNFPLFIKPRIGRGSRGCRKVINLEALELFIRYQQQVPTVRYMTVRTFPRSHIRNIHAIRC